MKRSLLSPLAVAALVGALLMLIGLSASAGPQGVLTAAASSGSIDFAKIDADPGAPGIQACRSVSPGEKFSIDLIVGSIDAADSSNFALGGNIGFNFNTGDFTSPDIAFESGVLGDIGDLTSFPLGTSDEKAAGKTHVGRAYMTGPSVSAPGLVGTVAVARATLTAGTKTGMKPIRITKSTPLDGSFDFFMGASPSVQPATVQSASIAIGANCPSNNPPSAGPQGGSADPDTPQTITLTATDPDGDCPLTFSIVSGPSSGELGEITDISCTNGTATAEVIYTPQGGFLGTDTFTYRVSDGTGESEEVSVSVAVGGEAPSPPPGEGTEPPETTPAAGGDTDADTDETIGPDAASQPSDDDDTNWTLITIIAIAAAAAAAALAAGAWWRLRRPGRPGES
jgi:hypothetical protein